MSFVNLVDLAAEAFGGRAIECSDDFFASMHNLVKAGRGVLEPDRYTDRGKWMDGWESRRRRAPGHDHCVVALGARGVIRALDIDTDRFLGNHPPFASMEAARLEPGGDVAALEWVEILPRSSLRPGAQNLFTVRDPNPFTHVKLHIYPDGGVARLRVWGEVDPDFFPPDLDGSTRPHVTRGEVDLAAAVNGGKALACSDAFFSPMDNLLLPGRAENMGGGWEPRRRRDASGNDWILLRLGDVGTLSVLELDTNHFKGNFADRIAVRGILAEGATITELCSPEAGFETLLEPTALRAHQRHFFSDGLLARGPFSHLRVDVYPDGGLSRFRAWGHRRLEM